MNPEIQSALDASPTNEQPTRTRCGHPVALAVRLATAWKIGRKAFLTQCWASFGHALSSFVPCNDNKPRVLFFAHSRVILDYVITYWHATRPHHETEWRPAVVLFACGPELKSTLTAICMEHGLPVVSQWKVPFINWKFCLVTDHCFPDVLVKDNIPIAFYYHGLSSIKMYEGRNYKYTQKNTHDRFNRLKYSLFFEAGSCQAEQAVRHNPDLRQAIRIVGDPKIDAFLEELRHRREIRKRLGLGPRQKVVMLQCTWGPHSLDKQESLLKTAAELASGENMLIVLSTHPNHWSSQRIDDLSDVYLGYEAANFRVLRPDEKRIPWLATADACVSDITSDAILFAFAMRPLAFFHSDQFEMDTDTECAKLMGLHPRIQNPHQLKEFMLGAGNEFPEHPSSSFLSQINSNPRESGKKFYRATTQEF